MKQIIIFINFCISVATTYIFSKNILLALTSAAILVLTAYAFRTYEYESLESINEQFIRLIISAFFTTLVVVLIRSIGNITISIYKIFPGMLLSYLILPIVNVISYVLIVGKFTKEKKYLVIGKKEKIIHILEEITEKSKGKYIFSDYVNPSPATVQQKLKKYENILVADFDLYKHVEHLIKPYKHIKNIEYLSDLSEKVLKRIPLEVIDSFKEYYILEFEKAKESPAKRIFDILGGIAGLVVFSPIVLISAIIILIEDGTPVVFKQLRIGKDNKEFLLVKLRSMRKQTDGKARFADQEKDRILKIGKIIRPTRLDESLQFWNILKGDMSIVGPRPEQIPFVREFEQKIPYYSYRHKLKPGLTGWAQIMYQYSSTLEEVKKKLEYDLYYIKNRSTLMDLRIILQTIEAVFWRRGAR